MSWLGGIKLKPTAKDAKGHEAAGFSVQLKPVQKDAPPAVNPLLNVSLKKVVKDAPEKALSKPREEDNLLSPLTFDFDDKAASKKMDDLAEKPKLKEKTDEQPGENEKSLATQSIKKEDPQKTNAPEPVVTKTAAGKPFIIGDGLQNIVARRGQIGKFEIKFGGRPEPNCTWSREGVDLVSDGKKIKIESSLGKSYITIRDAVRGDTAIYKATISNSKGTCNSEAEFVVLDKPPTPKGPLRATEIRPTSIAFKWQKPERTKDMDTISGYILEKLDIKTGKWTRAGMCGPYEDTIKAENLTANTTYKFRIKAVNREGESDPLELDDTVTTSHATGELFPPGKPKVTYVSQDSVDLEWKNAVEEGVQAAKFVVQMKKKDAEGWADVAEVTDGSFKAYVTGLEEDLTYDFRILAVDDTGRTEPSKATTAARASAPSIDRSNLGKRVVGEGEMISLEIGVKGYPPPVCTWTFRGAEIENDRMKANNEEDNKAILIVYKADRQDAGTYTLRAVNDSGEDEVTLEFVVACKPGPPRGPLEIVTAADGGHHILTWQKPEDDGGNGEGIVYRVFKKSTSATEWEEVGETENLEMDVTGVPEGESCFFKVFAWNSQGESDAVEAEITIKRPVREESQCRLPIKSARIDSMLEDVTAEEGDDICFSAAYSGEPPPTLTWYHGSEEIFPSEMTTISNDGRTSTLTIKNAKQEHRGTYTLIASNSSGEDELSASVTFMKKPMDPTDLTVTETEGADGECTLEWKPNSLDAPTHYQVFKCLEGTEDWMPISRVREPRAVVSGLLPSQMYKFRVCAINPYGSSKGIVTEYTRATRQRKALSEVQLQRPKFIRELSYDYNLITKELVLECEATSDSLVTPQWFRNGREIKYNPRFRWEVYGGIYRLYISKFERIDEGEYTCLLTNSAGKSESSTRVRCEDLNYRRRNFQQPDPIRLTNINSFFYGTHGYPHKGSLYKPMQWHRARNLFQRIACTVENEFEPYFTFCLRPRIVQYREDSCKLTCCISGNPKPQVTWYFESRELDKMEYNITFVDGVATLQIEDCKPQDSGEYRCVASNSKGSCEGSCVVVIENRKKKYR